MALEQVAKIITPYSATLMPFGDDMSIITSAYSFVTNQGNGYKGYTVYPYKFTAGKSVKENQLVTIENVNFNRNSKANG